MNAFFICGKSDPIYNLRSVGIPQLYRVHLAFFYISGIYYNISRRVTGIRYKSLSPQTDVQALKVYKFLGYLTLIQSVLSITLWIASVVNERSDKTANKQTSRTTAGRLGLYEVDDDFPHPWFRCSVCLERRSPSSTSCGHLFCWRCIQEHALSSDDEARCPHCRSPIEPSQIVPLLNL
ncbi:peroxisome biogenesis factor 10 domain protein [Oesophagostomum dentatum]|uniref:RING-type E3 ubiquitin transferase n=1 Tax=Oesophagostomum dentatum TaxID=61180 RepID=A0A0B1TPR9_OESDE|nr:peroxisome biogenesis factor 10 domain protein [Oesophagostomum dentatum]